MTAPTLSSISRSATAQNPLLHLLKDTSIALVAGEQPDLTFRQIAVLLLVYLEAPSGGHTVRGTAARLSVTKPAITRAVDRLSEFDFVRRVTDAKDRRSVLIQKTAAGNAYLRKVGTMMRKASEANQIESEPENEVQAA